MSPRITRVAMTRPRYTPGRPGPVRMLVMHATAGHFPGDFNWLKRGGGVVNGVDTPVSVHYYINKTGAITQFVDDDDTAYHAGKSTWVVDGQRILYARGCNPEAVGIELENDNTGSDPYPGPQIAAAVWLTRLLVARHQIPRSQCVRHLDIAPGRKTDPAGFPWQAFVAAVYGPTPAPFDLYRVRARIDYAQIRTDRRADAPEATFGGTSARLQPGAVVAIDDVTNGWAHLAGGLGFVAVSLLERI